MSRLARIRLPAMPPAPRDVAVSIVRALRDAGHLAYLAGGCVRDEILGLHPKDYDVATDAPPPRIASLFKRTRAVGKAFGVMHVRREGVTVEVATFRKEHGYSDRRRPDAVTFTDAQEDALRRDFTINALFIDPLAPPREVQGVRIEGGVIDFVQGLDDMRRRLIRAVGDPEARLAEDNLRALRAVRFAARLNFTIDPPTADAIRKHAAELAGVSRERIGDELRLMLNAPSRPAAVGMIESLGLDAPVLNEPPRGTHLKALHPLDAGTNIPTALAAWAIGRAAPDLPQPGIVAHYRRALMLSNDETDALRRRIEALPTLLDHWPAMTVARQKRAASSDWFADALALVRGIDADAAAAIDCRVAELARTPSGLAPAPLITGDDLVAAGLKPGRGFGSWLDAVYDAQLEERVHTKDQAIHLAKTLAAQATP